MKKVKSGEYRISETEYKSQIKPILDLMTRLTSDDRKFLGTVMRDIMVDVRILLNTNQTIADNFNRFLGFLEIKFISDYKQSKFPETKETGQNYWESVKEEYFGLLKLGLVAK